MGNSIACISQQRKRTKAHSHEPTKAAAEQNSLKNLQILKKKSKLRSRYRAKNRSSSRRVLPSNIVDQEETEQKEGVMRVKMVLTKKEVKELLSMLGSPSSHGGNTEQDLFEEVAESERIAWTPSLQSIPESDDDFDQ
ncbi:hypothetical protein IEQ34_003192 [Dendrobium chrysotoxum]|uniref:Uncharacterized protein n=1 Tax=Dendrobium chrysotoxum TaxID=161865 RepID=A0AAV7HJ07_DENCH|nr:hypothetical protein IEQ34_003192 [Dendrobium chrysotoxum]